eukprot:Phypoly_transcript_12089.p1 GENE.Phypoly_transcript_12089~~Phypoly_transcript_12089.p1  ORF type:complete len:348 (-),score=49.20 Phypoly_transcript_12089:120-1118(-)
MNEVVAYLEGLNAQLFPPVHTPATHGFHKQTAPQAPWSSWQYSFSDLHAKVPTLLPVPPALSVPILSVPALSVPFLSKPPLQSESSAPLHSSSESESLLAELELHESDDSEQEPDEFLPSCKTFPSKPAQENVNFTSPSINVPQRTNPQATISISSSCSSNFLKSFSFELQPPLLQIPQLRDVPLCNTPKQSPQTTPVQPHSLAFEFQLPNLSTFNFQLQAKSAHPQPTSTSAAPPHTSHFRLNTKAKSNKFDYTKEFQSAFHALLKANEQAKRDWLKFRHNERKCTYKWCVRAKREFCTIYGGEFAELLEHSTRFRRLGSRSACGCSVSVM